MFELVFDSLYFKASSGLASIISLLLGFLLYNTEVRDLPHSLYRSLAWRKVLLLSAGVFSTIFSALLFYNQQPPGLEFLLVCYSLLHGQYIPGGSGTSVWAALFVVGVIAVWYACLLKPLETTREVIKRMRESLQETRDEELKQFGNKKYEQLNRSEKALRDEVVAFHAELQDRYLNVVLGHSVPVLYTPDLGRHASRWRRKRSGTDESEETPGAG